jgi:sulfite exporter TauE/SafE
MRWLFVVALALAPALALAEDTADQTSSRTAMHDYFDGERTGGYILIGMGVGGLVAGGLLYRSSNLYAKGASYALLPIGLLHLAAGFYINIASIRRVDKLDAQITKDNAAFVRDESKRMAGVSTQFTALKIAELVLATGGLTMAGIGWKTDRPRLAGAGLAIAAEMLLTFGFDIFAASRAHDYRDRLAEVTVSVNDSGAVIGLVRSF